MSKQNPNQDFYKIGGRNQSDGPDRGAEPVKREKQEFVAREKASHPAVKRSSKKK